MSGPLGSSQWMYSSGPKDTLTIPYSCRFNNPDDPSLTKTFSSAGNRKTFTISAWIKRGNIADNRTIFGQGAASNPRGLFFLADQQLRITNSNNGSSNDMDVQTSAVLRDPSAWYHVVAAVDVTQGTDTNRVKLYINGELQTSFATSTYPAQNTDLNWNNTVLHAVGRYPASDSQHWDGYLAEVHFIDGTARDADAFGKTGDYGNWLPVAYTGSHGTNGFYLDFADSGDLGDDESGNGNDYAENNITATDQMIDTPSNNFPVVPEGFGRENGDALNHSEGNLRVSMDANDGTEGMFPSWNFPASGKWYYEICLTAGTFAPGSGGPYFGIFSRALGSDLDGYQGGSPARPGQIYITNDDWNVSNSGAYWPYNQGVFGNSSRSATPVYGGAGDIYQLAVDIDNNKYWHGYNNSWIGVSSGAATHGSGDPANGTNPDTSITDWTDMAPWAMITDQAAACSIHWNFGQDSSFAGAKTAQGNQDGNSIGDFFYTPPSGFLAMCTSNLPAVAVTPSEHFSTTIYTGTGTSQVVSGVGFQPDMIWVKNRSAGYAGGVFDSLRGLGSSSPPFLDLAVTDLESSDANYIASVGSDGYTTGSSQHKTSNTGSTYAAWCWKAGGNAAAVGSNTNGSINTTDTSANTAAGFSISTYTGTGDNATVGHGLSKAPEMVIVKKRDSAGDWAVYRTDMGAGNNLRLHDDGVVYSSSSMWNSTASTSTVFSIGTNSDVNANTKLFVAYCFHSVDGFSKFSIYEGNGDADGTFVYTGFRPAFVMTKRVDTADDSWIMFDNKRDVSFNLVDNFFQADLIDAEITNHASVRVDLLSNGFKARGTNTNVNSDGDTFVYMAFAETPFKYANAR